MIQYKTWLSPRRRWRMPWSASEVNGMWGDLCKQRSEALHEEGVWGELLCWYCVRIQSRADLVVCDGKSNNSSEYGAFGSSNKCFFNDSHASTLDCSYRSAFNSSFSSTLDGSFSSALNESFSNTLNQMTEVHTLSPTEAHSMLHTHKEIITLRV